MAAPRDGLCRFIKPLFGLAPAQGADAAGPFAFFNDSDTQSCSLQVVGRRLAGSAGSDNDHIIFAYHGILSKSFQISENKPGFHTCDGTPFNF
jgi:hypothetical protein